MTRHRETPTKRTNPSGATAWVARFTRPDGRRVSAGTYELKRDAQDAIDQAYEDALRGAPETVGAYAKNWTQRRPRAKRTNDTNDHRVSRVLDVKIEGLKLRDWPFRDLKRRHALDIIDHLLRVQHRSPQGAINILRALSTLAEDAITDEIADVNPFRGVKVRANDPRATKHKRPVRVFTFEQMHTFAAAAATAKNRKGGPEYGAIAHALLRTFADTGMRLGEVLALRRADLNARELLFSVTQTTHEGEIFAGTKTDHGEQNAGRAVPCPPGLLALIRQIPPRIDTNLLFPTPSGRIWRESNFYRDLWRPTQTASGIDVRPHEMRHSYITHLRAQGVDDADLADVAGHGLDVMLANYTHSLGRSFDQIREVIG